MLKKRLLRTCKNVMAAAICISLAVGLSACGETQGERRHLNDKNDTTENTERVQESFSEDALKEQQEFEQYLDDYFKDVVTDDTLTPSLFLHHNRYRPRFQLFLRNRPHWIL